ncbi:MAG: EamA family transporter RarD [Phycisphaerales bacterium]|nr:EamA family transporter RarD [Phycisphaerales bacterium]
MKPVATPADVPSEVLRYAPSAAADGRALRVGALYGIGAYALWGIFPLYFKLVERVPGLEVLAHRIVWSVVFLLVLLALRRSWRPLGIALRTRRVVVTLAVTSLLIACNWLLFIWAVTHDHILQASLGYFINPLVNVLLGAVFLRERLRRIQTASVLLAAVGVGYLTFAGSEPPTVALILAATFGVYALLRKIAQVDAVVGLTVETALLLPFAAGYLLWLLSQQAAVFSTGWGISMVLMAAGVVTATPLLLFAMAARRLRLATLGLLQYIAPTGHFLIAVVVFREPFSGAHLFAFACIWVALAIYSSDLVRRTRAA